MLVFVPAADADLESGWAVKVRLHGAVFVMANTLASGRNLVVYESFKDGVECRAVTEIIPSSSGILIPFVRWHLVHQGEDLVVGLAQQEGSDAYTRPRTS